MDSKNYKRLGALIRKQREALGLSLRQLAEQVDVSPSTLLRLERGDGHVPGPDMLTRTAEVLRVPASDLYSLTGYTVPTDLPSPTLYLRAKYRDLSAKDLAGLARDVEAVFKRRGIDPNAQPSPGEDEQPDTKPKRRTRTNTSKKGGRT